MIRSAQDARDKLADAVWWWKGFCSARPPSIDEGDGAHLRLRDQTVDVMNYLSRIEDGKVRRIGDEKAIVLTYAEFEVIYDGFRALYGAPPLPDPMRHKEVESARELAVKILKEYQREAVESRREDLPF